MLDYLLYIMYIIYRKNKKTKGETKMRNERIMTIRDAEEVLPYNLIDHMDASAVSEIDDEIKIICEDGMVTFYTLPAMSIIAEEPLKTCCLFN